MSVPSTRTRPALGVSTPATMRNSVLFPQPEGPSNTTSSPAETSRFTPVTAFCPPGNTFSIPSRRKVAMNPPSAWSKRGHLRKETAAPVRPARGPAVGSRS